VLLLLLLLLLLDLRVPLLVITLPVLLLTILILLPSLILLRLLLLLRATRYETQAGDTGGVWGSGIAAAATLTGTETDVSSTPLVAPLRWRSRYCSFFAYA